MAASKPPRTAFGQRLARARLEAGARRGRLFTQTELAQAVGVTPPTISQYEAGASEPELAMIQKMAEALGVSPGKLAFGDAADPPRVPLASYQVPDHIARALAGEPPEEQQPAPKPAERPRAKNATKRR